MPNVVISLLDSLDVIKVRDQFPALADRAITDWVKFKLGMEKGLFSAEEADKVLTWFYQFPRLWEIYRPNFVDAAALPSGMVSAHGTAWIASVDKLVSDLKESPFRSWVELGFAPVVIAGVLIVGGVAAALWAVGYVKQQSNLSTIIDGVTAGKIPADVLRQAVEDQNKGGFFDDISGVVKWGAIALAAWFLLPIVADMFKGKKSSA